MFTPHAILETVREIPSPIFIAAIIGSEKILRVHFDHTKPQDQWIAEIIRKLPKDVVAFGEVTGSFVNYTPNRAVEYDCGGTPVCELSAAKHPGRASMTHKGRDITDAWRVL